MNHYKSWSALNRQLTDRLCPALRGRITYFLTRYHTVHNAYGRAAIRMDGREIVYFAWPAIYRQESDLRRLWEETSQWSYDDPIIRILAILDRRVGRRTLQKIRQQAPDLPPWVRQFYDLRLSTM